MPTPPNMLRARTRGITRLSWSMTKVRKLELTGTRHEPAGVWRAPNGNSTYRTRVNRSSRQSGVPGLHSLRGMKSPGLPQLRHRNWHPQPRGAPNSISDRMEPTQTAYRTSPSLATVSATPEPLEDTTREDRRVLDGPRWTPEGGARRDSDEGVPTHLYHRPAADT